MHWGAHFAKEGWGHISLRPLGGGMLLGPSGATFCRGLWGHILLWALGGHTLLRALGRGAFCYGHVGPHAGTAPGGGIFLWAFWATCCWGCSGHCVF